MSTNITICGNGSPVVLVHGSMGSKEQWQQLAHHLSRNHRVLAFDLLGYGQSPWPRDLANYCLGDECANMLEIINDHLGEECHYHLVGHSYGGAVAIRHSFYHGQRVRSLTTIEPMCYHLLPKRHPLLLESEMMVGELTTDIERGDPETAAAKFIDLWMTPGTFERLGNRERQVLAEGVKKMIHDFRAAATEPLSASDLNKLSMPFCLILGTQSPPYSLCISEIVAEAIPQRFVHWIGGGHFIPFTHAKEVNDIIGNFIDDWGEHSP